jgi:hypothetical protein
VQVEVLLVVAVLVMFSGAGGCSFSGGCAGSVAQVQVDVLLVVAVLVVLLRCRWKCRDHQSLLSSAPTQHLKAFISF